MKFRMKQAGLLICCLLMLLAAGCGKKLTLCQHDWAEATCTQPRTCRLCGMTQGLPLGHDWDGQGRCTRCGGEMETLPVPETQPAADSSVPYLEASWADYALEINGSPCYPMLFDRPVVQCTGATLHLQCKPEKAGGTLGTASVYVRADGRWEQVGKQKIEDRQKHTLELSFPQPMTFDALAVSVPGTPGAFSAQIMFYMTDFRF